MVPKADRESTGCASRPDMNEWQCCRGGAYLERGAARDLKRIIGSVHLGNLPRTALCGLYAETWFTASQHPAALTQSGALRPGIDAKAAKGEHQKNGSETTKTLERRAELAS